MKKKLVIILILCSAILFSQTLNEKKRQLQELQDKISNQEKIIEDAQQSTEAAKKALEESKKK